MPKPKYETWFMEGLLIEDHHYIVIKADYSDLESKLKFFIDHPQKAKLIVENANKHINQFKDQKKKIYFPLWCSINTLTRPISK
jgi:hypothetical protein